MSDRKVLNFPKTLPGREMVRYRAHARIKHTAPWQMQHYGNVLYKPYTPNLGVQFDNVVTHVDFKNRKRLD